MKFALRILKWTGFGLLGLLLLLVGLISFRFIADPEDTKMSLEMLYVSLIANHYPPPIAASGVVSDGEDWMMPEPAGSKFTAILRKTFPTGTNEAAMQAALSEQGFTPAKEHDCSGMPGAIPPQCPQRTLPKTLRYDWGGVPCNQSLTVNWKADKRGRLTEIVGSYDGMCL